MMNPTENVIIELASDGMIVQDSVPTPISAECYVIGDTTRYIDDRNESIRAAPLWRLWLTWFGSLPLLATIIDLIQRAFGS